MCQSQTPNDDDDDDDYNKSINDNNENDNNDNNINTDNGTFNVRYSLYKPNVKRNTKCKSLHKLTRTFLHHVHIQCTMYSMPIFTTEDTTIQASPWG